MNAPTPNPIPTTSSRPEPARPAARDHDQSMGFWLNEPAILDPGRVVTAMRELAEAGYGIVRVVLRQTNFCHRSPEVVAAMAVAVRSAHEHGMRLVLDCEPHGLVAREVGRDYPSAIGQRIHRGEGPIRNGLFRVDLQLDAMDGLIFDHIACAALSGALPTRGIPVPACDLTWETTMSGDGIADSRQDYVAGRSFRPRRHVRLSGSVPGAADGRIILYACFREISLIDFAAPETRRWYVELLDAYRGVPLDGVCWDEPAVGGDWRSYRSGTAFAKRFADLNGYSLGDRLYLMDEPGLRSESVRVRLDYYRTLNETLAEAQAELNAAARERFGPDILLGNHHTWQGEGGINDYRAGAVDYFHLNDAMDAGYTDCCWWDPASVAYSYALCSSLGRLTPSGRSECNSWHWKPTNRATRYHSRLMSLMRISWFNIWYGDDGDTCMFPRHYTWATAAECARRHRRWLMHLGGARPVVAVAVLHDWQGICGTNLAHAANLHKAFCMNVSERALAANLAFDFVDARLVADARIEGDCLVTRLGRYAVLVVPGAAVIGRAAWERILAFANAGGAVIFAGPPPTLDDRGEDLTSAFAGLVGIDPIHACAYDGWYQDACPELPQSRPERFDLAFPVAADRSRVIRSSEGDVCGVAALHGATVWFTGYEASEAVVEHCLRRSRSEVSCHSSTILWRLYRDDQRTLLMLVAKEDTDLSGIIQVSGHCLRFDGGESACVVIPHVGEMSIHSEDAAMRCVRLAVSESADVKAVDWHRPDAHAASG